MDHQKLTHNDTCHVNLREQRTRIFLDAESAPAFVHIKGMDNTATDGLSQLPMANNAPTEIDKDIFAFLPKNLYWEENSDFPLDMKRIMITQKSKPYSNASCQANIWRILQQSTSMAASDVTTFNGKVWVPKEL
jgi:hypothetical protein